MRTTPGVLRLVTLISGGALCAVVLSCSTTSGGTGSIPKPNKIMVNNTSGGVSLDTLNSGYEVFLRSCYECHKTVPTPPTDHFWHPEPLGQKLYSSLSASERYSVIEYLRGVKNRFFKIDRS